MRELIKEIENKIDEMSIPLDGTQAEKRNKGDKYYTALASKSVGIVSESLQLKDRLICLLELRLQYTQEVIDLIAEELDINSSGLYLYKLKVDDRHPIIDILRDYLGRGGDKTKLKKRVAELEKENAVLRSLVGK